jgi:aldehyde:ferredoxin oxidoreductase
MLWTEADAMRMLGTKLGGSRFDYEGKATLVKWCEEVSAVCDSLGLCKITQMALSVPLEYVSGAIRGLTGWDMDVPEMLRDGERVVNLERLFDARYGISRKDDRVPVRYATEPLTEGPSKGHVFSIDLVLDEYYRVRGWSEDGVPSASKVKDLGLEWACKAS